MSETKSAIVAPPPAPTPAPTPTPTKDPIDAARDQVNAAQSAFIEADAAHAKTGSTRQTALNALNAAKAAFNAAVQQYQKTWPKGN